MCKKHLLPVYNIFDFKYQSINSSVNIDESTGKKLALAQNPNLLFQDLFSSDNALKIFTDGSKNPKAKSVGSACYCPDLNISRIQSIPLNSSIVTAECLAIDLALNIALTSNNPHVQIFTDSYSALQML